MLKHTPGPWKAINSTWKMEDGLYEVALVRPVSETKLGRAYGRTEDEAKANARLIASAPEMVAMLRHLVSLDQDDADNLEGLKDSARELIAKAEGL